MYCLWTHRNEDIQWSMVELPDTTLSMKTDSLFQSNSSGGSRLLSPLHSMLEYSLAWSCAGLRQTTTVAVSFKTQQFYVSRRNVFLPVFPKLWLLQFFYAMFCKSPWAIGGSNHLSHSPLHKEMSWWCLRIAPIYVSRYTNLEGSIIVSHIVEY